MEHRLGLKRALSGLMGCARATALNASPSLQLALRRRAASHASRKSSAPRSRRKKIMPERCAAMERIKVLLRLTQQVCACALLLGSDNCELVF